MWLDLVLRIDLLVEQHIVKEPRLLTTKIMP